MTAWQRILQLAATYLKGDNPCGVYAQVRSRRFDTDAVLEKIMHHDKEGFASFYERYRGRVYRFIVRQHGTGEYGKAAYYSAWRHLVVAGLTSRTAKDLKLSFYQYLGQPVSSLMTTKRDQRPSNYLPRDIEQDGNWSLVLIDHFKRLNDDKKRYFLFKHEIGISEAAIARTFEVRKQVVESSIKEAESELRVKLEKSGCPKRLSLEKLYRESRVVKPPVSWDGEILRSFNMWLKQADRPNSEGKIESTPVGQGGVGEKWTSLRQQVKTKLSMLKHAKPKVRERKLSSFHR